MKNYKFFKPEIFSTNHKSGVEINKLLLRRLSDLGVTTADTCCSDGTQTIDQKIAALRTQVGTYKEYRALITQAGSTSGDIPSAIVLNNTLGLVPVFTRTSAGLYVVTDATGKFTTNKTSVSLSPSIADTTTVGIRTSANEVSLNSAVGNTGVATDSKMTKSLLVIQVWS